MTNFNGVHMKLKKSWREKLHERHDLPKVVEITDNMSKRWGEGTCAIPAPIEVDGIMKKVRKGKVTTINKIRESIALKHGATIGCPITTGIFAWIAAHAAEEDRAEGKKKITPWWRTLKTGGLLNEKYPGGIQNQIKLLEEEGHTVIPKGKKIFMVEEYEKKLMKL
jgi:alkylated DNA nucleotide flippase Atl1